MKKRTYTIDIQAPATEVSAKMLGEDTFKQWTSVFNPTSYFQGGWNKGDKICFIGLSESGKREGMVARIEEHIPNTFVSIHHYGLLDGDQEILEGPQVDDWANAHENYTFKEKDGITTVIVDVDVNDAYLDYFNDTWPKALKRLKEICE